MSKKSNCRTIKENQLLDFYKKLPYPMGMQPGLTDTEAKKILLKVGIKSRDGLIYFNELLYRLMREQYVTGKFTLDTKMTIIELTTQFKLHNLMHKQTGVKSETKKKGQAADAFLESQRTHVNPLITQIFLKISFNMWHHYMQR